MPLFAVFHFVSGLVRLARQVALKPILARLSVSVVELGLLVEWYKYGATQHFCYNSRMNSKQMKKWLEQLGATFQPGKGSHLKVLLNGKQSTLPMHGTQELGKGLEAAIKRQLGLKNEGDENV